MSGSRKRRARGTVNSRMSNTRLGRNQRRRGRRHLANWSVPVLVCGVSMLLHWGCPSTPPEMFTYRAINDDCNCQEFKVVDRVEKIGYLFRARYVMDNGIVTNIGIEFTNNGRDTLFLERGSIKVASNNFN